MSSIDSNWLNKCSMTVALMITGWLLGQISENILLYLHDFYIYQDQLSEELSLIDLNCKEETSFPFYFADSNSIGFFDSILLGQTFHKALCIHNSCSAKTSIRHLFEQFLQNCEFADSDCSALNDPRKTKFILNCSRSPVINLNTFEIDRHILPYSFKRTRTFLESF